MPTIQNAGSEVTPIPVEYVIQSQGAHIGQVIDAAFAWFTLQDQTNLGGDPNDFEYFFVFNDIKIVWKPHQAKFVMHEQFTKAIKEREAAIDLKRRREAVPDPTRLEIHDRAMREMGKHFRVFTRIGRWGTCGGCPTDGRGDVYPEFCSDTKRYDHQLTLAGLVQQYGIKSERASDFLHRERQDYRNSLV